MGSKHNMELLIEINKKISQIIDKNKGQEKTSELINDLNSIIRQLDHMVEELEKQ